MARKKSKKIRAEFRKNRSARARRRDWTQQYDPADAEHEDESARHERISGKGELTRHRTVVGQEVDQDEPGGFGVQLDVDLTQCRPGRVLAVRGLISIVADDDTGEVYQCATRRLLKTLSTDQRHVVVAGDRVMFRAEEDTQPKEGMIERVEPRRGTLCRTSRGRQHLIVTNVERVMIIASAAEPVIKPNLIDRMIIAAEKGGVRPVICINKVDLVDRAELQPLVGVYAQMGYDVLTVSAATGLGLERFRRELAGRESVLAGQSGVGKSSLLAAIDPQLQRDIREVSRSSQKGRHTTTTAELLPLSFGGWVVDTPGIRQFQLWDVIPEEVAGFFRDIRPYVSHCRYPDCTHTHEDGCAVKDAVADSRIDCRRYDSYCHILEG